MEATFYDQVAYGGNAMRYTAPNLLAGVAMLLGLDAPAPSRSRVLELGCGNGANLIPLAHYWPNARFVGIDLAPTAVDEGRGAIARLGLRNVEIEVGDIGRIDPASLGEFDYVIAHGVFSWVPEAIREALLGIVGSVLSPVGVGYLSYNAMPGCRVRHLVRDLLHFRLRGQAYSPDIIDPAWQFLDRLGKVKPPEGLGFFGALHREAVDAMDVSPQFLFHDDLSPDNQPFYLHEFATHAAAHGLQVIGDADPQSMSEPTDDPDVKRWLDEASAGDWVARMQYVDFVRGSRFNRTLVARAGALPAPGWTDARIAGARWHSELSPEGDLRLDDASEARFSGSSHRGVTTNHPLIKAALVLAHTSPTGTITTTELADRLQASPSSGDSGMRAAGAVLLHLARSGLITPVAEPWPNRDAAPAGEHARPRIHALTRELLERGQIMVDNAHHNIALSEPWIGRLALLMDGATSIGQLCERAQALGAPSANALADPLESLPGVESLVAMLARRGLLEPDGSTPDGSDAGAARVG